MWIVLDSTEFRRARADLNDADLQALFAAQRGLGVRLAVPEVVLREVTNAIGEEATAHASRADRELGAYASWTKADVPRLSARVEADVAAARERFLAEVKARGVRVLPLPDLPHDRLVARDLARRKPFENGRGYRDALLWESVLRLAAEEPVPVVLVTANRNDFGSGTLHPHLAEDVAQKAWPPGRVALSHSAAACWEEFLRQKTRSLPELVGATLDAVLRAGARRRMEEKLGARFTRHMLVEPPFFAEYRQRGYEPVATDLIEPPALGRVESATSFPDGTRLFVCPGTFRAVQMFLQRGDWYYSELMREVHGTFTARIVKPPGDAPPHVKADAFHVVDEADLSEDAQAFVVRQAHEAEKAAAEEERFMRDMETLRARNRAGGQDDG